MRNARGLLRLGLVALAWIVTAGCAQPPAAEVETPVATPEPTSPAFLKRLDALGARYWTNDDGQVYYLSFFNQPVIDADLEILKELPHVSRLSLHGVTNQGGELHDGSLAIVAAMPNLERLDLSANWDITDEGIAHLANATKLERLDFSKTGATSASLETLSTLPIRWLSVPYPGKVSIQLDEHTVEPLSKMPLEHIEYLRGNVDAVPLLKRLQHLKTMPYWDDRTVRDTDLHAIAHIKGIEQLEISLTEGWSNCSHLKHLASLPRLKHIVFSQTEEQSVGPIDREGLLALCQVESLRTVYPYWPTDELLGALSEIDQLEYIALGSDANITNTGLTHLAKMPNLRRLDVPRKTVDSQTFAVVSRSASLERLAFGHAGVGDYLNRYGLQSWPPEPRLYELTFEPDDVVPLTRMPKLAFLNFSGWPLTDAYLKPVGQIASLRSLGLAETRVTDAGLEHLYDLTRLRLLGLEGVEISYDAANELGTAVGATVQNESQWGDGIDAGISMTTTQWREMTSAY